MKNVLKKLLNKTLILFMNKRSLLNLFSTPEERMLLDLEHHGYLHDIGWYNSMTKNNIVDRHNNPLPWVTYPFISFIENRLKKDLIIFEFGSGNSTLYYAKTAGVVYSIENDASWYEKIKSIVPANVNLFYCQLEYGGDYSNYALNSNNKYDLIIVDGRDRVNCCINSINALSPKGIIVLDDCERQNYQTAVNFLLDNGFRRIDFWGTAPAVNYLKCTTIFYKDNNCLNI